MDRRADPLTPRPLRLFFALWPDEATRSGLAAWAAAIHRASGGRVIPPPNLHLTLAFLGSVRQAALPAVEAAAATLAPPAFTLVIDQPGCWRHNGVAWAGASEAPAPLLELVAGLRAALGAAGIAFDPKPFVPHVTLVRAARAGAALPALAPIRWPVRDFALVESRPAPAGSVYTVRARWG